MRPAFSSAGCEELGREEANCLLEVSAGVGQLGPQKFCSPHGTLPWRHRLQSCADWTYGCRRALLQGEGKNKPVRLGYRLRLEAHYTGNALVTNGNDLAPFLGAI
eukprot:CAMPEP_0172660238 /NCGR_PEP_ID=MMETSP1074-20121228/3960_1 /TAXON_ID=2916 /ORGANISM="Ceratium fusus, Strain PA161109" /LENGTH=104 /DNA_ID=CAMNT_0013475845 /DNA_START=165 /DNA_END=479 /DNA_ORIENTATION=-